MYGGGSYPTNPTVMTHNFSQTPKVNHRRSAFNRSYGHKTTFNGGYLIPFFWDQVYPGDTMKLNAQCMIRVNSALIRPVMDNWYYDTQFFFIPFRLLWSNFQKFMGEQDNPGDSISFTIPQVSGHAGGFGAMSIYDYCGVYPYKNLAVNNWVGRAYNLTIKHWFRDENLDNSPVINVGNGPDTYTDYPLFQRRKRYDYFTQCLPWPQKFGAVSIPLGTSAPIVGIGALTPGGSASSHTFWETNKGSSTTEVSWSISASDFAVAAQNANPPSATNTPQIFADLTNATAATINSLRQAFTLQQFLERDARGGTRYPEIVWSHFGVDNPDARVQIPEYLGGSSSRIGIQQVPQTSPTSGSNPQGQLAGFGLSHSGGHGFLKSFTEHGIVMGFLSARADLTYQQGTRREFFYQTRYDLFWPDFENLGEQAVLNQEIYTDDTGAGTNTQVFGYVPRYDECRTANSMITGIMRSNASSPLDVWHTAQDFGSLPTLNTSFIEETPPFDRNLAVGSGTTPHFLADIYFDYKCVRPMGTYGVPGLSRM